MANQRRRSSPSVAWEDALPRGGGGLRTAVLLALLGMGSAAFGAAVIGPKLHDFLSPGERVAAAETSGTFPPPAAEEPLAAPPAASGGEPLLSDAVQIRPVERPRPTPPPAAQRRTEPERPAAGEGEPPPPADGRLYRVRVGPFWQRDAAERVRDRLAEAGFSPVPVVLTEAEGFTVQVGAFREEGNVRSLAERLRQQSLEPTIVEGSG